VGGVEMSLFGCPESLAKGEEMKMRRFCILYLGAEKRRKMKFSIFKLVYHSESQVKVKTCTC
jgi:hypothetical protein